MVIIFGLVSCLLYINSLVFSFIRHNQGGYFGKVFLFLTEKWILSLFKYLSFNSFRSVFMKKKYIIR